MVGTESLLISVSISSSIPGNGHEYAVNNASLTTWTMIWSKWADLKITSSTHLTLCFCICFTLAIVVKEAKFLGPQQSAHGVNVSRDGGYSVLIHDQSVWLYDDSECFDSDGRQISFVSNTAATIPSSGRSGRNSRIVSDSSVVDLGLDRHGRRKMAALGDQTFGNGDWIPFTSDEANFNGQMAGKEERVAIWPGTSPTSLSPTQAFLFAPLVYVDMRPQDPSQEYQSRGMILISITMGSDGPVASRQGNGIVIPGTEVGFGGLGCLVGRKSTTSGQEGDKNARDVYLLGINHAGVQLARVDVRSLHEFSQYDFWKADDRSWSASPPLRQGQYEWQEAQLSKEGDFDSSSTSYIPGSFSSGSVFFSPYYQTFLFIYMTKMADSTFYMQHLDLSKPHDPTDTGTWQIGGKHGRGIQAEDIEALTQYAWSEAIVLYISPTSSDGFNYAGNAHPEFFNRQYFPASSYSSTTPTTRRLNPWFGGDIVPEDEARADGQFLLLSFTAQLSESPNTKEAETGTGSGTGTGTGTGSGSGSGIAAIYQVQMALIEFATNGSIIDETDDTSQDDKTTSDVQRYQHIRVKPQGQGNNKKAVQRLFDFINHNGAKKRRIFSVLSVIVALIVDMFVF